MARDPTTGPDRAAPGLALCGELRSEFELTDGFLDVLTAYEVHRLVDVVEDPRRRATIEVVVRGLDDEWALTPETIECLTSLRWIHSLTAGVEPIASARLIERNIALTNSAGCYGPAIAEYVFAAMVSLFRSLPELVVAQTTRTWGPHPLGREVCGAHIGVIGYGGIGRRVATLAGAAGARVWAVCRDPGRAGRSGSTDGIRISGLDSLMTMLSEVDLVVVAASLNPGTFHLLGAEQFAVMARGAYVVNVSRGSVLDEAALGRALESGRLGGAFIDTTELEPLPRDHPIWSAPNLWLTPHMAGGTREGKARALELLEQNLRTYRDAGPVGLGNVVDVGRELSGS